MRATQYLALQAMIGLFLTILCASLWAQNAPQQMQVCSGKPSAQWVATDIGCLKVYQAPSDKPTARQLLVYLHGDSNTGGNAARHFPWFGRFVDADTHFAAIVRPGYHDAQKNASAGSAMGGFDNYTASNVDAVAQALEQLKKAHAAQELILVGYSGGAANAALILGRYPGLVDKALLLACPCDMQKRRKGGYFRSLNPQDSAAQVPARTQVWAATGSKDSNTTAQQVQGYIASLQQRGVAAHFELLPGLGHEAHWWEKPWLEKKIRAILAAPAVMQ